MTVEVAGRTWRLPGVPWARLQAGDWSLLAAVTLAIACGMGMLYSATLRGGPTVHAWDDLVVKQAVFAMIGMVVLAVFAATDYRALIALAPWIYGITVALLAGILAAGAILGGSQRWFDLGALVFQPSEFTKVVLIIGLVAFWERYDVRRMRNVLASLVVVAVPALLVLEQPNLSTAILLGFIWLGVTFVAGVRPLHLGALAMCAAPAITVVLRSGLIQAYQIARITALIDPAADPQRTGYQNIQTLLAVGNGGLTGTGFAGGLQSQGGWLPLAYTDNIYALVAEELGFVGGVAVLALLLFIVWRVVRIAERAQDRAGTLVAAGVAVYLLAQIAVNVGVVLQMLPVTGLSLPFLSYGGSSLSTLCAAIGLVQAVLARRKPLEFR